MPFTPVVTWFPRRVAAGEWVAWGPATFGTNGFETGGTHKAIGGRGWCRDGCRTAGLPPGDRLAWPRFGPEPMEPSFTVDVLLAGILSGRRVRIEGRVVVVLLSHPLAASVLWKWAPVGGAGRL